MPLVNIHDKVSEQLGPAIVNIDALAELYYGDLGLPRDIQPIIDLRPIHNPRLYGFHIPFSRKVTIDPMHCLSPSSSITLGEVVVHESQHLADSVNKPIRSAAFMASRLSIRGLVAFGTYKAIQHGVFPNVGEMVQDLTRLDGTAGEILENYINIWPVGFKFIGRAASQLYYKVDPAELRARKTQHNPKLLTKYSNAINFPLWGLRQIITRNLAASIIQDQQRWYN